MAIHMTISPIDKRITLYIDVTSAHNHSLIWNDSNSKELDTFQKVIYSQSPLCLQISPTCTIGNVSCTRKTVKESDRS